MTRPQTSLVGVLEAPTKSCAGLPIRLSPFPQESFAGYLIRLTERNYYPSVSWLYSLCGVAATSNCLSAQNRLAKVMPDFLGLDANKISVPLYDVGNDLLRPKSFLFRKGCVLPADYLSAPKFCPSCLAEFGFQFQAWDFKYFDVCPRHKCFLIEKCPCCSKQMNGWRPKLSECSFCQFDLRKSPKVPAPSVLVGLSRLMAVKIGVPFEVKPLTAVSAWEQASTSDLLGSVHVLMRYGPSRQQLASNKVRANDGIAEKRIVASCFVDWPHGFYSFLDKLAGQSRTGMWVGARKAELARRSGSANTLARLASELGKSTCTRLLDSHFKQYVAGDPYVALRHPKANTEAPVMTAEAAAKELGVTTARVGQLVRKGKLLAHRVPLGASISYSPAKKSIRQYKADYGAHLDNVAARSRLGISDSCLDWLVKNGWLEAGEKPIPDVSEVAPISDESIARLFERISKNRRECFCSLDQLMPFSQMFGKAVLTLGVGGKRFFAAVLEGHISACYEVPEVETLDRFLFTEMDLARLMGANYINQTRASQFLGVADALLLEFARAGAFLKMSCAGKGRLLFDQTSLREFSETHVSLGEVKRRVSCRENQKQVLETLLDVSRTENGPLFVKISALPDDVLWELQKARQQLLNERFSVRS